MKLQDTYLVSGLMVKGFLPRTVVQDEGVVYFLFDENEGVEDCIEDYKNNRLDVPAMEYANMVRSNKQRIWQTLKGE